MIDLDLDVIRRRDGQVFLVDEDEFAEHRVKYGYPADVVTQSQQSAAWLQQALADGTEPFASVYRSFRDIDEFMSELEKMARDKGAPRPDSSRPDAVARASVETRDKRARETSEKKGDSP